MASLDVLSIGCEMGFDMVETGQPYFAAVGREMTVETSGGITKKTNLFLNVMVTIFS